MSKNTQNIREDIKRKMKEAPSDWAVQMAEKKAVTVQAVYAWARCERGVRDGKPEEVLLFLNKLLKEQEERRKKLIA